MKLLLAIILLLTPVVQSATYYVDNTGGADGNDGLSVGNAWETIQKGLATATAGDTVFIRAGTYDEDSPDSIQMGGIWTNSGFSPANNGTEGNEIVFKAYPDEMPLLLGSGFTPYRTASVLTDKSYIIFDSLHFRFGRRGIYMESGHHITIRYCIVDSTLGGCGNNNGGFMTYILGTGAVKHILIENSEFYANGEKCGETPNYISAVNTSGIHAYSFDSSIIRYNTFHHQEVGIHIKGPAQGGGWDTTSVIEIYGNTVYTTEDAGIWILGQGYMNDISVHHNVLYDVGNNSGAGFMVGSGDEAGLASNIRIWNNTIDGIGVSSQWSQIDSLIVINNIMYKHYFCCNFGGAIGFKNQDDATWSNLYTDYNLSYRTEVDSQYSRWTGQSYSILTYRSTFSQGANSQVDDPLFTDADNHDYSLQEGSPALTGGLNGTYFGYSFPVYQGADSTGVAEEENNAPTVSAGATQVDPSSVDRIGSNTTTISTSFNDADDPGVGAFTVTFKIREPNNTTELTLVNAQTNGNGGLTISDDGGGDYTASYTYNPDDAQTLGLYDLYFYVTDGEDNVADDYGDNLDELTIIEIISTISTGISGNVNILGNVIIQ